MIEIINNDYPITKVMMDKEDAKVFYEKEGTKRGKLQLETREKKEVMLYYCNEFYNYFYGVMPITTGHIKIFDIMKYHNGFLIRYPAKEASNKIPEMKERKK